jgi:hypothetical protein
MDAETRREPAEAGEPLAENVARGRSAATPFAAIGGLAAVIWTVVALVAAGALLLWWLL